MQRLIQAAANAAPMEELLSLAQAIRTDPDKAQLLDMSIFDQVGMLNQALRNAQHHLQELERMVAGLTALPWHAATFLTTVGSNGQSRAVVRLGNAERVVGFADGVQSDRLGPGDPVYLSHELNVIMAAAEQRPRTGATCVFERKAADGRLVVKSRDEQFLVLAPASLVAADLKVGDLLAWNPEALVATEKLERTQDSSFFLEDPPRVTFEDIGGLDSQIEEIRGAFELHWSDPETARLFRLPRKGSLLLVGPAGTGKTMIAKALARWLADVSGVQHARFMNIKPGALHSMWYSQSEANYRELFRVAREAGARDPRTPVVMFFDEVDSIGVGRGHPTLRVADTVITAFIAELDGLAERGNVFVVSATNRRDALDPAIARPGRLGDVVIEVPRPNREAARQILGKHLADDIPYERNGHGDDLQATRAEIIDAATSYLYAPNGAGDLAQLVFRDAKRRSLRAADLISGAVLANISLGARERACRRRRATGELGLRLADLLAAIDRELEVAVRSLTPANCRQYLGDLPYDSDVVNIERTPARAAAPHRLLNLV